MIGHAAARQLCQQIIHRHQQLVRLFPDLRPFFPEPEDLRKRVAGVDVLSCVLEDRRITDVPEDLSGLLLRAHIEPRQCGAERPEFRVYRHQRDSLRADGKRANLRRAASGLPDRVPGCAACQPPPVLRVLLGSMLLRRLQRIFFVAYGKLTQRFIIQNAPAPGRTEID